MPVAWLASKLSNGGSPRKLKNGTSSAAGGSETSPDSGSGRAMSLGAAIGGSHLMGGSSTTSTTTGRPCSTSPPHAKPPRKRPAGIRGRGSPGSGGQHLQPPSFALPGTSGGGGRKSIGEDAPASALWRAENIRPSGPPSEADWWAEVGTASAADDDETGGAPAAASATLAGAGAGAAAGSISPQSPPRVQGPSAGGAGANFGDSAGGGGGGDGATGGNGGATNADHHGSMAFCNQGLAVWEQSREEWRRYPDGDGGGTNGSGTGGRGRGGSSSGGGGNDNRRSSGGSSSLLPGNLPPAQAEEVIRGLTRVTRTFELPAKMALPDLIDVLVDVWECDRDY